MKLNDQEIEILEILEVNSRLSPNQVAKMIGLPEDRTREIIERLESERIIIDYMTTVNWLRVDGHEGVKAMIDVKVAPKRGVGFDDIASRIYRFKEVKSVYLMSGAYDLSVVIEGRSMSEIAHFVSEKLSTLDSVLSTTTHFILKKYKHDGKIFEQDDEDKRIVVSP
ncbi:Lrp/AsnC family transcriptional regulator [Metabacillus herbersteinensis]|uniref:Lrp/AsnC family transcriptional regulator n=1 Tax=Metabacillus herbersteinensis TaxID=283816 RepID=A0ABV6GBI1_9BACI